MSIGVAVIGAGMAGRGHAAAFRAATSLYGSDLPKVELISIGDVNAELGQQVADRFGYERSDSDWRAIADNPKIHAVSVVVANHLHREIVEGLLAAGKHVLCEKPLSDSISDAEAMVAAANQSKTTARIGLTYLRNPAIAAISQIVSSGELGKVLHFSGRYWADYCADPNSPMAWRYKGEMGTGALGDIGSHVSYISEFITGSTIKSVSGARFTTAITKRPIAGKPGEFDTVENDDYAGFTVDFGDAMGAIEVSRVAWGHPTTLTFEIFGEHGAAVFDQRRNGEFKLMMSNDPTGRSGYRNVQIGPWHPYIQNGLPVDVPGVGVGQNDQFFFQNRAFLQEVAGLSENKNLPFCPSFEDGLHNMRILNSVIESSKQRGAQVEVPSHQPTYLKKWNV